VKHHKSQHQTVSFDGSQGVSISSNKSIIDYSKPIKPGEPPRFKFSTPRRPGEPFTPYKFKT